MSARLRASKTPMSFPATLITWGLSANVKLLGQLQAVVPWILHASYYAMSRLWETKSSPVYGAQGTVKDAQGTYAKAHDGC